MEYFEDLGIRNLVFASGERFPLIIANDTGVPNFEITFYVLTQLRSRNLSTSTITVASRAIMFVLQLLAQMRVDLQERIYKGRLLEAGELERLIDGFSWPYEHLRKKTANSSIVMD
ncbi:hypothetical protein [Undibacterium sp. Ji49W]|uniref:hypothetical protein n=1 Tax=Undibacterium sp. Ji49W TaxID=3413040 RepID=UPI003BF1AC6A